MKSKRALSALMCLVMLLSLMMCCIPAAEAKEGVQHKVKTHDIAVVYDNSGSMYVKKSQSWCNAKYATEIFGSMLDFDAGDTMTIFPMWYVSTSENPADKAGSSVEPVKISSTEDLDKVSRMYTPGDDGTATPFEPANEALEYLKKSSKDEKWLVVLTDGAFNMMKRTEESGDDYKAGQVEGLLKGLCTDGINVQYLAMTKDATDLSSKAAPSSGFYADIVSGDETITSEMISICNRIFERQVLPSSYVSGNTVNVDVSMSKMIVFVTGKGANVKSMTSSEGKSVDKTADSGVRKYSDVKYSHKKLNSNYDIVTNTDLYGEVVTFSDIPAGTYTLDYAGSDLQIFYEPDVDIKVTISSDAEGKEIIEPNENGEVQSLPAGNYYVNYDLVDSYTGTVVTDSPLVKCKNMKATAVYTDENGKETSVDVGGSGNKVEFKSGQKISFEIEGNYLDDYTIHSTDEDSANLTFNITDDPPLTIDVTEKTGEFRIGSQTEWDCYTVKAGFKGGALDEDLFDDCELKVSISPSMPYRIVPDKSTSSYKVYVGVDEDGKAADVKTGKYEIKFYVACNDSEAKIANSPAKKFNFDVTGKPALEIKVDRPQSWYQTGKQDKWECITVNVTCEGEKLSEEYFENSKLDLAISPDISYRVERDPGNSCYKVWLGVNDKNEKVDTDVDNYKATFSVSPVGDKAKFTKSQTEETSFKVRSYPFWYLIFFSILGILIIIGIVLFILSRKAMPKKIDLVRDSTIFKVKAKTVEGGYAKVSYNKKTKSLSIKTPPYDLDPNATGSVSLKLKPIDRLWTPSKNRRVTIIGVSSTGAVAEIGIQGLTYERHPKTRKWTDSSYLDDDGSQQRPIAQNIRNATIDLVMKDGKRTVSSMTCDLKHR